MLLPRFELGSLPREGSMIVCPTWGLKEPPNFGQAFGLPKRLPDYTTGAI